VRRKVFVFGHSCEACVTALMSFMVRIVESRVIHNRAQNFCDILR